MSLFGMPWIYSIPSFRSSVDMSMSVIGRMEAAYRSTVANITLKGVCHRFKRIYF